jgi:hypothetical protein
MRADPAVGGLQTTLTLTGNPAEDTKLASTRLFRRFQALESLAEDDREAIIKVIDAMVIKHQTRQMVDGLSS